MKSFLLKRVKGQFQRLKNLHVPLATEGPGRAGNPAPAYPPTQRRQNKYGHAKSVRMIYRELDAITLPTTRAGNQVFKSCMLFPCLFFLQPCMKAVSFELQIQDQQVKKSVNKRRHESTTTISS